MFLLKKIFNSIKTFSGILWDFPPPSEPLTYHRWKPVEEVFAWVIVLLSFFGALAFMFGV